MRSNWCGKGNFFLTVHLNEMKRGRDLGHSKSCHFIISQWGHELYELVLKMLDKGDKNIKTISERFWLLCAVSRLLKKLCPFI